MGALDVAALRVMPVLTLSPICSLSSCAMRSTMSMTNLPMAVVESNFSIMELKSFPLSFRTSIIWVKLTLFLWILSILRTRTTSHLSISENMRWYSGRATVRPE